MIQMEGYRERWFAGAGALGFDGLDGGHPPLVRAWKWLPRLTGHLDPRRFTVITKTVTALPRQGNQTDWTFWRCARPLWPLRWRSMVNAVALTNPGLEAWHRRHYPRALRAGIRLVLSLHLDGPADAEAVGRFVARRCGGLAGVQLNANCPNLAHGEAKPVAGQVAHWADTVREFARHWHGPLLCKYGYAQPWLLMCQALEGFVTANELINALPWKRRGVDAPIPAGPEAQGPVSPLAGYGYDGSVSGGEIVQVARRAVREYTAAGIRVPLISGGGVVPHPAAGEHDPEWVSLEDEAFLRLREGAEAVAFSTAFLWEPWGPRPRPRRRPARPSSRRRRRGTRRGPGGPRSRRPSRRRTWGRPAARPRRPARGRGA
jgi:dihydroorotate dehydrogenase